MTQNSCNSSSYNNLKGAVYASSSCYHTRGCSSAGTASFERQSRLESLSRVRECESTPGRVVVHGRHRCLAGCDRTSVFPVQSSDRFAGGESQFARSPEHRPTDARVEHCALRCRAVFPQGSATRLVG